MSATANETTAAAAPRAPATRSAHATVAPVLPIALLEAMRSHDRPSEVLEDEDLAASLPRRLGLTDVIDSQIKRYQEAGRRGVRVDEVADLLRLVLRRPDAEAILRDAGQQLARVAFGRASGARVAALRVLPAAARFAAVRRAARGMLRRVVGDASLDVAGRPVVVRITRALTAAVDAGGTACVLYASAIEELVFLYTRTRAGVRHVACAARGDPRCEWTLAD